MILRAEHRINRAVLSAHPYGSLVILGDSEGDSGAADGPSEVTRLLSALADGSPDGTDRLASLVYDELHVIAVAAMRREVEGHTLQPTELVHEAYQKLVGQHRTQWRNRHHFFGIAAQAMRRLLVDHARARRQLKRDGGEAITLTDNLAREESEAIDVLALHQALDRLAALDPRQVQVVELRYFAGLELSEVAETLGVSRATVVRDWAVARAFLRRALAEEPPTS